MILPPHHGGGSPAASGAELPQLAQPAIQARTHVARQVVRLSRELPVEEFRYRDRGTMATIGRRWPSSGAG